MIPRISEVYLNELAALGVPCSYKKGEIILRDGEIGQAIYILLQGKARAYGSALSGKEITYGYMNAGEYFGEMTLDGGTRSASIEAVEKCDCVVVQNQKVEAFMQDNPKFATQMLHTVIFRARQATDNARDIALLDVYSRLKRIIEKQTPYLRQSFKITHTELASDVGASREMVSKLIKDLALGGYVEINNKTLTRLKDLPLRW